MNFRILIPTVLLPGVAEAESFLVEGGQPRAEIVIAEDPPRTTRLAARELQTYLEKINGAKLEIGVEPCPPDLIHPRCFGVVALRNGRR